MRQSTQDLIRRLVGDRMTRPGYVYFLQGPTGPIKIGWSASPYLRKVALERELGVRLATLSIVPGTMLDERRLHTRFAHLRLRPDREWFDAAPELLSLARGPARTRPLPSASLPAWRKLAG
jgi:hypothetical protein